MVSLSRGIIGQRDFKAFSACVTRVFSSSISSSFFLSTDRTLCSGESGYWTMSESLTEHVGAGFGELEGEGRSLFLETFCKGDADFIFMVSSGT